MVQFTVTNLNDAGAGSLRQAILDANASVGVADTILFQPGLSGPVVLTSGELTITDDLTIDGDTDGDNKADITLDGNDASRVMRLTGETTDVALHSLTITGGNAELGGGGVYAYSIGSLLIADSTGSGNRASGIGGFLSARNSDLTMINTLITENEGSRGAGVGVFLSSTAVLTNVTMQGNRATSAGGGLYVDRSSTAAINNSTIFSNLADSGGTQARYGGGLFIAGNSNLTLTNTVVAGNTSGGALPVAANDDVIGTIATAANSFIGTAEFITTDNGGNINGGGNAGLGALADNGGTTQTLAILQGSQLISAGNASELPIDTQDVDGDLDLAELLPLDASGNARVIGTLDIGAVEFNDTIVVDTLDDVDDGDLSIGNLSLREALRVVSDGGTISFASSITGGTTDGVDTGVITLNGTQLEVTRDVTIDGDTNGDNKADITLDGNDLSRVLFLTGADTDADLRSLTITGGNTSGNGAGILASRIGTLSIADSTISNNSAIDGGGISAYGTDVTMINALIADNIAAASSGGALFYGSSTAALTNVTIDGNRADTSGGGFRVSSTSSATINNSTITRNRADDDGNDTTLGGGIHNAGGSLTLENSVMSDNTSGGALATPGVDDVFGAVTEANNSFFGTSETITGTGNIIGGGDAGLGRLADNGGTVQTRAILQGSQLFSAGNAALLPPDAQDVDGDLDLAELLPLDANGNTRVIGALDIGAVEFVLPNAVVDTLEDVDDGDLSIGNLSLREALRVVADGGTITFDPSSTGGITNGVITLNGTELLITRDVVIDGDTDGDNKADITLSGNQASRVLQMTGADTDVVLRSLTITGGQTSGVGGGVYAKDINTFSVTDSSIIGNGASYYGGGIGAYLTAVTMFNTLIADNESARSGGGASFQGGTVALSQVTVHGNSANLGGGGISVQATISGTISNSTISDNLADADGNSPLGGGGIFINGALVLENTVVAGNTSGGGATATAANNDIVGESTATLASANSFFGTTTTITTDNGGNIIGGGDAGMAQLADNGGTTMTLALGQGSQLTGNGNAALLPPDLQDVDGDSDLAEPLPQDANGKARVIGTLDIGAVELIGPTPDNDDLLGTSGAEIIDGLAGDDTIRALGGDDTVIGGFGADSLDGGAGAGDTLSYIGNQRAVTVDLGTGQADAATTFIDLVGGSTTTTVLDEALVGNIYINVHSITQPGGELRGQVGAVLTDETVGTVRTVVFSNIALLGANEVPPVATDASGTASLTMVNNNGTVTYDIGMSFAGLTAADIVASHFHQAAAGSNGSVVENILAEAGTTVTDGVESDQISGFENITGGASDDSLTGDGSANRITGGAGADTLDGAGGADEMTGGTGDDTYRVDSYSDVVTEAADEGTDTIETALGAYSIFSLINVENLTGLTNVDHSFTGNTRANGVTGNGGNDTLIGSSGNDTLVGLGGNDRLEGGTGTNVLQGGAGHDSYVVSSFSDTLTEGLNAGTDTVLTALGAFSIFTKDNVENVTSTTSGSVRLTGNVLDNVLTGNEAGSDTLVGSSGNDTLVGLGGNDRLEGGTGTNVLQGGAGNDTYVVSSFSDTLTEGLNAGTDTVLTALGAFSIFTKDNVENVTSTTSGSVRLTGNVLDNVLTGNEAGSDTLVGSSGNDTLVGLGGNDRLEGGTGTNVLQGGAGNDTYVVSSFSDTLTEGLNAGTDTVLTALGAFSIFTKDNVENVTSTTSGSVRLTGNVLDNVLTGNEAGSDTLVGSSGNDTLVGLGGNDRLEGGTGTNVLQGGAGNDTYVVSSFSDTLTEGLNAGTDTVLTALGAFSIFTKDNVENVTSTTSGSVRLTGNVLDNVLTGNEAGNDTLVGSSGNDTLVGLGGNDRLEGGTGTNVLQGGAGNDTYVVSSFSDTLTEGLNAGTDTVLTALGAFSIFTKDNVENVTSTTSGSVRLTGNVLDNVLTGNEAGSDTLVGSSGNDTLVGLGGNDRLEGGTGTNVLQGGAGNDTYVVSSFSDTLTEGLNAGTDTVLTALGAFSIFTKDNVENVTSTTSGSVRLTGNVLDNVLTGNEAGSDTLVGSSGNDTLVGLGGNDRLEGGAGLDVFVFNTGPGAGNLDEIADFSVADDTIHLDNAVFTTLGAAGALSGAAFHLGTAATTSAHHVIFDAGSGALFFDADGTGGSAQIQVATMNAGLALTSADIFII